MLHVGLPTTDNGEKRELTQTENMFRLANPRSRT